MKMPQGQIVPPPDETSEGRELTHLLTLADPTLEVMLVLINML